MSSKNMPRAIKIADTGRSKEPRWNEQVKNYPHPQGASAAQNGAAVGREAQGQPQGAIGPNGQDPLEEVAKSPPQILTGDER